MKRSLLLVVACSILTFPLAAEPKLGANGAIDLGAVGDAFFRADPSLGITEISSPAYASSFEPAAGEMIWTGSKSPSTWLRFSLPLDRLGPGYGGSAAGTGVRAQWLLVVKPSFSIVLDQVSLFVPAGGGAFEELRSGAKLAARAGEPRSRSFVFELPAAAFSGVPCFLRIASSTDVKIELLLERSVDLSRREGAESIAYGVIFGIVAAMSLYGLFVFLSLKDASYLFYVLYSISAGLWIFFVQGFAKLLFGQHPGFDQVMLWFWAGAMIAFGALFSAAFLKPKNGKTIFHPIFIALAVLGGLVSVAGLAGFNRMAFTLSHWLGVALSLVVIGIALSRLVLGFPSSLFFLIAWVFMGAGGLVFSLMGFKILPVSFLTVNSMAIGLASETVFLAMALSDRFKRLEDESKRLEKIQARYRYLSFRDPLTGLHNERYLGAKLPSLLEAARSEEDKFSLMVLDLDNLKLINDSYGHERGDEVLKVMARGLRACLRGSDLVCRLRGDEFVVAMPGTKEGEACRVAERLRSRFALDSFSEREKLNPSVSAGVAEYRAGEGQESLRKRADEALREAKRLGKDRVMAR